MQQGDIVGLGMRTFRYALKDFRCSTVKVGGVPEFRIRFQFRHLEASYASDVQKMSGLFEGTMEA